MRELPQTTPTPQKAPVGSIFDNMPGMGAKPAAKKVAANDMFHYVLDADGSILKKFKSLDLAKQFQAGGKFRTIKTSKNNLAPVEGLWDEGD